MSLIGHDDAWRAWRNALSGQRMHHAWLLSGISGIGKAEFARAAAGELVGQGSEPSNHPDIIVLDRPPKDKKEADKQAEGKSFETARNIKVDQVRAMQRQLTTRPTLGDKRVVIVSPADAMERSASNALLKSLEEPPVGTFFILVSHNPARLLPTIRSRCRTLRFAALDEQQMNQVFDRLAPDADPTERNAAIVGAGGSPGSALQFLELGLIDVAACMRQLAQLDDSGHVLRGELVSAIGNRPSRQKLQAVLDLALAVVADEIADQSKANAKARITAHGELVRLSGEIATYNYDPGLLIMEIGTLLARIGQASERANA